MCRLVPTADYKGKKQDLLNGRREIKGHGGVGAGIPFVNLVITVISLPHMREDHRLTF